MSYTDRYVELPIIIYNDKQLELARKQEDEYDMTEAMDVPYIVGTMKLPPSEIIGYYQTWTRSVSFEDAQGGNLDAIVIATESMGTFLIYLSLQSFEKKLNDHMNTQEEKLCVSSGL